MSPRDGFALLDRWVERGDRADLLVALDALEEAQLPYAPYASDRALLDVALHARRRGSKQSRARVAALPLWTLVHQITRWKPTDDELRDLLALALRVRRAIPDEQRIVGGRRGYINLTGLLWWTGAGSEPESFRPRITTVARFVESGDSARFKAELLDDFADRARRAEAREQRSRGRSVYEYETGARLEGRASRELIARSAASDTGAVPAYRSTRYVWHYVAPQDVEHHRRQQRADIVTVYVVE